MALTSLYLNRLRSLLSIMGIVFGVMAVMVIIAVGEGVKKEAIHQIEQLGIRNIYIREVKVTEENKVVARQNYSFGLTLNDMYRLKYGCATVENTAALKVLRATIIGTSKNITPEIAEVTPSYKNILDLKLEYGRFISTRDCDLLKEVCVLGHEISRSLGKDGQLGSIIRIENEFFKIVGILRQHKMKAGKTGIISARNYDDMILLPLGLGPWLEKNNHYNNEDEVQYLTEIIIQVDKPKHVLKASRVVKRIMENIHPEVQSYQIKTPLELLKQTRKTKRLLGLFLVTIAAISLLVGGIGIMNIMLATVSERKKEIGIRRAVGAKKKHILIQFLTESSILTFLGGTIGIFLGGIVIIVISFFIPGNASITIVAIIIPLIISSLTGLFFGLYPAYIAAGMDPIQALRS